MVAGMSPLTPPPSMLSIVTMRPYEGGDFGVAAVLFASMLEGILTPRELIRKVSFCYLFVNVGLNPSAYERL